MHFGPPELPFEGELGLPPYIRRTAERPVRPDCSLEWSVQVRNDYRREAADLQRRVGNSDLEPKIKRRFGHLFREIQLWQDDSEQVKFYVVELERYIRQVENDYRNTLAELKDITMMVFFARGFAG